MEAPVYEVLLVGGPKDGELLEVSEVQEKYFFPVLDEFENVAEHEDLTGEDSGCELNTYRTELYNTVTVPGMSGKVWFLGLYQGTNMDDCIEALFRNYIND